MTLRLAAGLETRERKREPCIIMRKGDPWATVCRHDHMIGPKERHFLTEPRPVTRTRDEHSAAQPYPTVWLCTAPMTA